MGTFYPYQKGTSYSVCDLDIVPGPLVWKACVCVCVCSPTLWPAHQLPWQPPWPPRSAAGSPPQSSWCSSCWRALRLRQRWPPPLPLPPPARQGWHKTDHIRCVLYSCLIFHHSNLCNFHFSCLSFWNMLLPYRARATGGHPWGLKICNFLSAQHSCVPSVD